MRMLIGHVLDRESDPAEPENRTRLGLLEGWVSTGVSISLCALKMWMGIVSGSVSMIADATNNLTDAGSSLVIALGFHWSRRPRDEKHPFGHGRIETVTTLVLAIALILVGFEVGRSGIARLFNPQTIDAPLWLMIATGITVLLKGWMALFARTLARITKSQVIEADAWNHTFDVVCTLLVILALVAARFDWPAVDGWAAMAVSFFIMYTGVRYAREAIDILLGKYPEPEEIAAIRQCVGEVPGILGIHEIMVHQYGDVKMVSFHIEVEANQPLCTAHRIAEEAENAVESRLGWRTVAHMDPVDHSHPLYAELNEKLRAFVNSEDDLIDFHDLRVIGHEKPYFVSFDLVTGIRISKSRYNDIFRRVGDFISKCFPGCVATMEIGVETSIDSMPMVRRQIDLK